MFKKQKCPYCGFDVDKSWNFCPNCGKRLKGSPAFKDIASAFRDFSRARPSISIEIVSGFGKRPKVKVRRFGNRDVKAKKENYHFKTPKKIPKEIKEPRTTIKDFGNKKIVTLRLPNVNPKDLEIRELRESIEIRAFSGDRLYFKVIPISPNYSLSKQFNGKVLKLEIQN